MDLEEFKKLASAFKETLGDEDYETWQSSQDRWAEWSEEFLRWINDPTYRRDDRYHW